MPITKQLKMTDPAIVKTAIDGYFANRDQDKRPYTMIGLAIALGLNHRKMLDVYEDMAFKPDYIDRWGAELSAISNLIKNAKAKVEEYVVEQVMIARNPAGGIFIAKNMDYKDKQEIETTVTVVNYADRLSAAEERKRLSTGNIIDITPVQDEE